MKFKRVTRQELIEMDPVGETVVVLMTRDGTGDQYNTEGMYAGSVHDSKRLEFFLLENCSTVRRNVVGTALSRLTRSSVAFRDPHTSEIEGIYVQRTE